jgi:serine/threonine protein phosphatase PrpC
MEYKLFRPLCIEEIGRRSHQEDAIFPKFGMATVEDRLFILCDGLGGHSRGDVASNTVCSVLSQFIKAHYDLTINFTEEQIKSALDATYDALDAKDRETGSFDGNGSVANRMGTTLTMLCFHGGGVTLANIGDSRIYQVRPSQQCILFRTHDHSYVQHLVDSGEMTEEEARLSPKKNILTRAVIANYECRMGVDVTLITDVCGDDYFLMCSDGMLEKMDDDDILGLLCNQQDSDEEKMRKLSNITKENIDNHTAQLIHVAEVIR